MKPAALALLIACAPALLAAADRFEVVEASIDDMQRAIGEGRITCRGVVEAYIARARAYNGACTQLITGDGKPVAATKGAVRAGAQVVFPTRTRAVSSLLPDLDKYQGPPLDLGRLESTVSDPSVKQQYGMVAGIPDAGQVNALETLNIRGERSVTCKGRFDAHPSTGPLPAGAPAACEKFRQQPDALERAAELDKQYGTHPDLAAMPMYCVTTSIKDWYDVKDMRSTGGNDVNYAMDAGPADSTIVAALRAKGAIIHAVSIAAEVSHCADGDAKAARVFVGGGGSIRSSWGGHVCNPYDTERSAGPSSGGAGASVNANLVACGICETTGGSCREPASQNAVPSLVTTKGLISEDRTATAQFINHRPGILCRTLKDSARVLDAMKDPVNAYFDSRDLFTAIPKSLVSGVPYSSFIGDGKDVAGRKPLAGVRIGIVREYMVKPTPNDVAVSDRVDAEIKSVLRDQLGAELVESSDPEYPDDPSIANMQYTFQDALAEAIATSAPEYLLQKKKGGALEFALPGHDVTSRDYRVQLALRQAPLSPALNMRRILSDIDDNDQAAFSMAKYLRERGDARVADWAGYAANSKWRAESQAAGIQNAAAQSTLPYRVTAGIDRVKMQSVLRLAAQKVMQENHIDLFVHPSVGVPQWKIGVDREPTANGRQAAGPSITDLLGVPEITVPAGYNSIVYDPQYELSADKKSYVLVTGRVQSQLRHPMPFSINFWAGPGDEPILLRAASNYEAATKHRIAPADFGPLTGR